MWGIAAILAILIILLAIVNLISDNDDVENRVCFELFIIALSIALGSLLEYSGSNSQTQVIKKYQRGQYEIQLNIKGDQIDTLYKVR